MHIIWSNSVYLDVETIGPYELLIHVVSICSDLVPCAIVDTAAVVFLPKQLFTSSTIYLRIVDKDIVALGIKWFLDEWLFQFVAV